MLRKILLRTAVRLKFGITSGQSASRQALKEMERTLQITRQLEPDHLSKKVNVPSMVGIDPDMRDWSLYMILEHNAIVNRGITNIVKTLSSGEYFAANFDIKIDVLPTFGVGVESMEAFCESIHDHLSIMLTLPSLRGTHTHVHPAFNDLDAHGWHCMFAFQLMLHRRQVGAIAKIFKNTL